MIVLPFLPGYRDSEPVAEDLGNMFLLLLFVVVVVVVLASVVASGVESLDPLLLLVLHAELKKRGEKRRVENRRL